MARTKHICSILSFLFIVSSCKCFVVDTGKNKELAESCSTLLCSNQILAALYENSKSVLTEMENLLFDLRDEKANHQLEHELNKRLDYDIKLPSFLDYANQSYMDLDSKRNDNADAYFHINYDNDYDADLDEENDEMNTPVPFIVMHTDDEDGDERIQEYDSEEESEFADTPLTEEESIDVALSRIHDLEEAEKNMEESKRENNIRRYFR